MRHREAKDATVRVGVCLLPRDPKQARCESEAAGLRRVGREVVKI